MLSDRCDRHALIRAAEEAMAGRTTASALAIRILARGTVDERVLSPRQRQIMSALARGCTTREIAEELIVSPSTVKTHIARLSDRLGLAGREELRRFAARRISQGNRGGPPRGQSPLTSPTRPREGRAA